MSDVRQLLNQPSQATLVALLDRFCILLLMNFSLDWGLVLSLFYSPSLGRKSLVQQRDA